VKERNRHFYIFYNILRGYCGMKYSDITGVRMMLSNEEGDLLTKIQEQGKVNKSSLDDREKEVARKLVSRGILNRIKLDDKIYYKPNGGNDA